MSDDDDYQPLSTKKSSNKQKSAAPAMGPKSKRKPNPLEADNLLEDSPARNGDQAGDSGPPSESSPVKSKDPFQVYNIKISSWHGMHWLFSPLPYDNKIASL